MQPRRIRLMTPAIALLGAVLISTSAAAAGPSPITAAALPPRPADASGYVLEGFGGLHPYAVGIAVMPAAAVGAPYWQGWDAARGVAIPRNHPTWGLVVDLFGALHPFGIGVPAPTPVITGARYWPTGDFVRQVALMPDGKSGVVLDAYGGLWSFSVNGGTRPTFTGQPYWPGWKIAEGVTIMPNGGGGYVVDGLGGMHPFAINGVSPPPIVDGPYWPTHNRARGVTMLADGSGGYIVDCFGGVWPFSTTLGTAGTDPAVPTGTPSWPGWKIARSMANE